MLLPYQVMETRCLFYRCWKGKVGTPVPTHGFLHTSDYAIRSGLLNTRTTHGASCSQCSCLAPELTNRGCPGGLCTSLTLRGKLSKSRRKKHYFMEKELLFKLSSIGKPTSSKIILGKHLAARQLNLFLIFFFFFLLEHFFANSN